MADPIREPGRWLAEARAGDRAALGQALEACRRYLLLVAERHLDPALRAKGGASDLVQDTFLEAQRDFGDFAGTSEADLRAWLRRMLLNNLGGFSRRYRDTGKRAVGREVGLAADGSTDAPLPEPAADAPSPSGQAMAQEQAVALRQVLERLPEDYRQVIVLRYLEGRSFEEIARLLNRSPGAARKLWARAMQYLRAEWKGTP